MNYVNVEPTDFDDIMGSIQHEGGVIPIPQLVRSHGPIIVEIVNDRYGKMLTMNNIVQLLEAMTPDELDKFEADMQTIIDGWLDLVKARKA